MPTTITLLIDNKAPQGLKQEHGFSVFIEHQGKRILFDNGQSDALFFNADKLNVALTGLDIIVLSHGHYDHGGNLAALLEANPNALFYAHPDVKNRRYSLHPNKPVRTISLSAETVKAINDFPARQTKLITQVTEIQPGIWLTGQIPRIGDIEDTGGPFFVDKEGIKPDYLHDDMSLWIEEKEALTIICGCCHSGVMNTINHIKNQTIQTKKINILLGGLHLVNANQQRLNHTVEYLNEQNISTLYPAHCTGDIALKLLENKFTNNLKIAQSGLQITL